MNSLQENTYEGFRIKSPAMKKVYREIEAFAKHGFNCILFGPSGSGKEFLAHHYYKVFRDCHQNPGQMFSLNCQSLTSESARSELFGHTRGAFTNAIQERDGIFITAKNGVLFLDEIGELSMDMQTMLLRAIDPGEAQKLGSDKIYKTNNVAIVGATDRPPQELKKQLLYRMGQVIKVPGLEERKEDIPEALYFFINNMFHDRLHIIDRIQKLIPETDDIQNDRRKNKLLQSICRKITDELVPLVEERKWPGNFRSLNSVISSALVRVDLQPEEDYIKAIKKYFIHYADAEQERWKLKTEEAGFDPDIMHALDENFSRWRMEEKKHWATLLTGFKESSFLRGDLEDEFDFKSRTLQNRLKALVEAGVISSSGSKGDVYRVAGKIPVKKLEEKPVKIEKEEGTFDLPDTTIKAEEREKEIYEIIGFLEKDTHVFISGNAGAGKTTVAYLLGKVLKKMKSDVYYYELKDEGMNGFIKDLGNFLLQQGFEDVAYLQSNRPFMLHTDAAALSGYINNFFSGKHKPVFLIDNLQMLKSREGLDTLHVMLQYWLDPVFVFMGDKMSNELIFGEKARIVEFRISARG